MKERKRAPFYEIPCIWEESQTSANTAVTFLVARPVPNYTSW